MEIEGGGLSIKHPALKGDLHGADVRSVPSGRRVKHFSVAEKNSPDLHTPPTPHLSHNLGLF